MRNANNYKEKERERGGGEEQNGLEWKEVITDKYEKKQKLSGSEREKGKRKKKERGMD